MAKKWLKERLKRLEMASRPDHEFAFFIAYRNKDGTLTYNNKVFTEAQFKKLHEEVSDDKFVIIL